MEVQRLIGEVRLSVYTGGLGGSMLSINGGIYGRGQEQVRTSNNIVAPHHDDKKQKKIHR
jgi:predicted Rossmann-fold nucleotide-binding protein